MFIEDRFIIKPCEFFLLTHDTSKEFQEMLVKQQVAKTAQDIFMRIRFVGSSSQSAHDGL